jgi:hypothetical protein
LEVLAPENRKRTSTDARLTEVSPVKGAGEDTTPSDGAMLLEWKDQGKIEAAGAKQKLDFGGRDEEKGYLPRSGTPPPPPSAREQKRPKKQITPKKNKEKTEPAASGSEGRTSQ